MSAPRPGNRNKLLQIEIKGKTYAPVDIPEEYQHLLLAYADAYFQEDEHCFILSQYKQLEYFSFWIHDVYTYADITLCPITSGHLWSLHFMFDNSVNVSLNEDSTFSLTEKECNLLNLYAGSFNIPMDANQHILSFHINVQPSSLEKLAVQYPILAQLANKQTGKQSGTINETPYPINSVSGMLIKNILSCRYTGEAADYFLERCCLDLFMIFTCQDIQAQQPLLFLSLLYADLYCRLFDYLEDHPHENKSIKELAEMLHTQEDALRFGFRQHFAIPIEAFQHMLKMMLTYYLLLNINLSIPEIAAAAGFKDPLEMEDSFSEYYGCSMLLISSLRN